jgi:dienelactone hydrolase
LLVKVVYVAGAYRAKDIATTVKNIEKARRVAATLWRQGYAVICPHSNSGLMDSNDIPEQTWLDGYLEILSRCDMLVVVPGWEQSQGTRGEIDFAQKHNIPIVEWGDKLSEVVADGDNGQTVAKGN